MNEVIFRKGYSNWNTEITSMSMSIYFSKFQEFETQLKKLNTCC